MDDLEALLLDIYTPVVVELVQGGGGEGGLNADFVLSHSQDQSAPFSIVVETVIRRCVPFIPSGNFTESSTP